MVDGAVSPAPTYCMTKIIERPWLLSVDEEALRCPYFFSLASPGSCGTKLIQAPLSMIFGATFLP